MSGYTYGSGSCACDDTGYGMKSSACTLCDASTEIVSSGACVCDKLNSLGFGIYVDDDGDMSTACTLCGSNEV